MSDVVVPDEHPERAEESRAMSASLLMLPLPSDDVIDLDANHEHMIQFTV